ncbi:NAD-dependent epimerase/dehydratase family protein [Actinoallomurus spadix]|uniref:SDR family oxidoreductase n=1 Tax=Actinoallomurus spadix TaxID=79912 RepID=A0ABN0X3F2_9ACTN|nr:NAD-dependent epimerase/dehydratase family protein [Actinoallomurus spadix]MCO5986038.1 NAD-dependent epimerase/dehydratase family protein [Actinoallomurus spadix]
MRLLVLGGTAWLGGHIATSALERGHHVTCLARGESGTAPRGVEFEHADRDGADAYGEVARAEWDVVVDVSRQPGHVERAAKALADCAGSFLFVSSVSAYADSSRPGDDESAALLPALAGDVMESMETYGQAKVACERHVTSAFGPGRSLIARVGLIGGPGDESDRTGYWPLRFARPATDDGSVLVPDAPDQMAQVIDVRDVAAWLIDAGEGGLSGVFNVVGETLPLPEHLAVAREVAGHRGPVVAVDQDWLLAHDVEPWMGERSLPLWLPLPEYAGSGSRDGSAARAAGLVSRPPAETLADTLAWELTRDPGRPRRAGLPDHDERRLLRALTTA